MTTTSTRRQMTLIAFLQAQNCSNYPGSWRHPATTSSFMTFEYYQNIARTLEHGKFHLAFFDDRLAMPDKYESDYRQAVRYGVRPVKMDLIPILTAMGLATRYLGLGGTYSTTYYEPFHVARVFATLDLLLGGRAAWNVVTSLNDSEAANFGADEHLSHDTRYDRADEFMEVVLGHWDTWEHDAIILDRENDVFADPLKVHRLGHRGKFFRSEGPFTVPRSAQGRPLLIQAGQSGRGREFAARWGELIFVPYPNLQVAQRLYKQFKEQVAQLGRDPDSVRVAPAVYVITGETPEIVAQKRAVIEATARPADTLTLLSELLNFDFSKKPRAEAFTDEEMASIGGLQAIRDRVVETSGKKNPTVDDFVKYSGWGTINALAVIAGTPTEVADQMQEWFETACDGFVIAATHMPGGYEDFVRLIVPELQRRGLFRKEYDEGNLRENLGLPHPVIGDWRRAGHLVP